jgi:hypothetical protein
MYVMDFGGPIGYRLMLKYPARVTGVVVQLHTQEQRSKFTRKERKWVI